MSHIKESLVWIRDTNGKEYACYIDDITNYTGMLETLAEEEFSRCLDIEGIAASTTQ